MEVFGYLASVLMGLTLGMIGGGGSILTVPILVYLFGVNPLTATAYSLFIVGSTALVGGISYYRKSEVDLKTGFIFATPSFIGMHLTRAFVVPALPDPVFVVGTFVFSKPLLIMMVFALLMLAASTSMIRTSKSEVHETQLNPFFKNVLISLQGFAVGAISGFVGAGGGFLIIPVLVIFLKTPMRLAVGTSLFIIAVNSLVGFFGSLKSTPHIDWQLLFTIACLAVAGLFLGMRYSSKVSENSLKKGLGYFILLMGIFILFDQIKKL